MLMVQQTKGGGNTDAIFDQTNPLEKTNAGAGGARLPANDNPARRAKARRALAEHRDAAAKVVLAEEECCKAAKCREGERRYV